MKIKPTRLRSNARVAGMLSGFALAICVATQPAQAQSFTLEEATFEDMQAAMDAGALTSVELVSLYLNRIAVYDQAGIFLNSTPVINPAVFDEAIAADELRAAGTVLSPLHGVPFTVKDTFSIAGMPTAGGSPALLELIASEDALIVSRLQAAGAVALGKANLPPMGNGTSERSVYGAGKNPYNFNSPTDGSSYGSAIGPAANLVAFSFGGDTTGSIRFPASAQNIAGLKPSKALFPTSGTWWLGWDRDVIGPMTRTIRDLAIISDLVIADYPSLPTNFEATFYAPPSTFRPASYVTPLVPSALAGKKVGVPKPFIGEDFTGTSNYEIGPRVEALLRQAMADIEALGAEVVLLDWPGFHTFARDNEFGVANDGRNFTPATTAYYFDDPTMGNRVRAYYNDEFIKTFNNPLFPTFGVVAQDTDVITYNTNASWLARRQEVRDGIMQPPTTIIGEKPFLEGLIEGFDLWAKRDVTDVMEAEGVDVVIYPVRNNVSPLGEGETTAAFPTSFNWGGQVSTLGLPALVVPMGFLPDSGVPVGLTFLGPARNTDDDVMKYAYAYEQATNHRIAPAVTPALPGETIEFPAALPPVTRPETSPPAVRIAAKGKKRGKALLISGTAADASGLGSVTVYVNGRKIPAKMGSQWTAKVKPGLLRKIGAKRLSVLVVTKDVLGNTSVDTRMVLVPKAIGI